VQRLDQQRTAIDKTLNAAIRSLSPHAAAPVLPG